MSWQFFRAYNLDQHETYILAGDESGVSKSGKQTHGLDRFFSSVYGKPIPSVSFFSLSLVGTTERRSYPMMAEQVIRSEAEKAAAKIEYAIALRLELSGCVIVWSVVS